MNPHFKLDSQNDTPDSLGGKSKREVRIKKNGNRKKISNQTQKKSDEIH